MDLKQLQHLQALAKYKSFSRAAESLNIAQPALSLSIKRFENSLGVILFHRGAGKADKSVSLTQEGKILWQHAKLILGQVTQAKKQIQALAKLSAGEVRIAVPGMLGSFYLPSRLMAFRHKNPKLKLSLFEGGTRDSLKMLEHEEVDIAIITEQDLKPHYDSQLLVREQMVVAMSPEHPLTRFDTISLEHFFEHELVMFKTGYFHREWILQQAKTLGLTANIAFETNLINLIKQLVAQDFAITSVLQMIVSAQDDIIVKPFEPAMYLNLHIAWKNKKPISHADKAFVQFLLANV